MNVRVMGVAAALAGTAGMCLGAESAREHELIADNRFQRGFVLWEAKPGQHVRYGEIQSPRSSGPPVWGLAQWGSKYPLAATSFQMTNGVLICSNQAKAVTLGLSNPPAADLALAVNSAEEYGPRARAAGDPWVHLLVEQEFVSPPRLADLAATWLHLEARLLRMRNRHQGDYAPDKHAAQFQIFFTVQNRNRESPGHGDLLWFGVPIYDNRARFPSAHKAQDFGGTAKFIFTPSGETYAKTSLHDGDWVKLEADLLPLMREALETAWARGFLQGSKDFADYHIGGMNMGWEMPGSFDAEVQVRQLSLKLTARRPELPPKTPGQ